MAMGAAAWFLWELWTAAEPKPVTDDFLKLLHESFARNWRDPRTWPWSRMLWAYRLHSPGGVFDGRDSCPRLDTRLDVTRRETACGKGRHVRAVQSRAIAKLRLKRPTNMSASDVRDQPRRSVVTGSTDAARRAGINDAINATVARSAGTAANVNGSSGLTP